SSAWCGAGTPACCDRRSCRSSRPQGRLPRSGAGNLGVLRRNLRLVMQAVLRAAAGTLAGRTGRPGWLHPRASSTERWAKIYASVFVLAFYAAPVIFAGASAVTGAVEITNSREPAVRHKDYSGVVIWLDPIDRQAPAALP